MYYFISDVHLGLLERSEDILRESIFLKCLDKIAEEKGELFLIGDVFDYWFEYEKVVPAFYYRTLAKFYEMKLRGINITYLMGNHDFGHHSFFKKEFGIEILKSDVERTIGGKKFYLAHGDGKADNDTGYLILRSILRNRVSQLLFRWIHPDIGIRLASSSSRKSRVHTDKKNYGTDDGLYKFAMKKLEQGYDYVVMGHRHKKMLVQHAGGLYVNLGEWVADPSVGIFDGEGFTLISTEDFLRQDPS